MLNRLPQVLVALSLVGLVGLVACEDDSGTTGPTTAPDPVTDLTVTVSADGDTITLAWTPVALATSYLAELRSSNPDTLSKTLNDPDASEAVFTPEDGLDDEKTYEALVMALNSAGSTASTDTPTVDVDYVRSGCNTTAEQNDPTGTLRLESSILWDNVEASATDPDANFTDASGDGYTLEENKAFFETAGFNNLVANPNLPTSAYNIGSMASPPDFIPTAMPGGYTAFDVSTLNEADGLVMPTDGRTLQATTYAGAVAPGTALADAWYYGWTVFSTDGSDSRPITGKPILDVTADILTDRTFYADTIYRLNGRINVGSDRGATCDFGSQVTLTIEPGTTILGELAANLPPGSRGSYLVVTRGNRIIADANRGVSKRPDPDSVIVFTSAAAPGERARGQWGGLVINGCAPLNTGSEAIGEGDSGLYGGDDPLDDSGILRGVRVEFAGDRVSATDELNGIALQGAGAGTTIDYAQVHYNQDDGTEPFGGTASQTHIVVTGIEDDSFDGTDGYQGFMQFLIAQQRADAADNGFEISNNGDDPAAEPESMAVIANATMIGAGTGVGEIGALGTKGDIGVLFREGSHYRVFNVIAVGFGKSGFDVEGSQTAQNADCRIGR